MRKSRRGNDRTFTMKSAMSAILGDASGKMHHEILFDRRLFNVICSKKVLLSREDRNSESQSILGSPCLSIS